MAVRTHKRKERIYVKVTSDFDATGYMNPKSITWEDGRVFPIDRSEIFARLPGWESPAPVIAIRC